MQRQVCQHLPAGRLDLWLVLQAGLEYFHGFFIIISLVGNIKSSKVRAEEPGREVKVSHCHGNKNLDSILFSFQAS